MKTAVSIVAPGFLAFVLSGLTSANAQDVKPPVLSFDLTASSNYIFRGISQTRNQPAVFGSARLFYDDFYISTGMENVNFNNGIAAEYDVSGGWTPAIAGFNVNLGVIRYGYVNEPPHTSIDTVELKGSVSHAVGPVVVGGAIFYTPDYFGTKGDGIYVEGNAAYHITPDLSVSGVLGRQTIDKGGDYTTWNMGVGYDITKNLALDARYYDTDGHQLGKFYNSHFVGSVKASF